jgi:hypothetical protein
MEKIRIDNTIKERANKDFLEFLKACPHVVPPNIGLEEFEQGLEKALDKFVVFNTKTLEVDPARYF